MSVFRAAAALGSLLFWRAVAAVGGPAHPSYTFARWRCWQSAERVRGYLKGE